MFEREYLVRSEHSDANGVLQVATLMKWLNDIMEENANSYGAGAEYHLRQNLAWVLAEYQIDVERLPKTGESVKVGTLPYSFKRMFGFRLYRLTDKAGNPIVKGKGKFLLINIKTKEMVRPSKELLDKFTDAKKEPESLPFPKWKTVRNKRLFAKTLILTEDMADANGHLNNAQYVRIAQDLLQNYRFSETKSIRVRYKQELFPGDEAVVAAYEEHKGVSIAFYKDDALANEIWIHD